MIAQYHVIADLRGLVLKAYFTGTDPDAIMEKGNSINTAGYGLDKFIDRYLSVILEAAAPIDCIAVLDMGNDYRKDLYPQYKAKREPFEGRQRTEIDKLMRYVKELWAGLGGLQCYVEGTEGDDVVAYLCQNLEGPKLVFTIDEDLVQLASPEVTVYRDETYVDSELNGLPTSLIALRKSIVGDTSDNYVGVKGVGMKSFEALQANYGNDGLEELDTIVRDQDWKKLNEYTDDLILLKLYEQREQWAISYSLARLHPELCNVIIDRKMKTLHWNKRLPNREIVTKVLNESDNLHHLDRFEKLLPCFTLVTQHNLAEAMERIRLLIPDSPVVPFDYETYDTLKWPAFKEANSSNKRDYVDVLSSKITGCSFALGPNLNHVFYLSTCHKDTANVDPPLIKDILLLAEAYGKPTVAHNFAFEDTVTRMNLGLTLKERWDTALIQRHLDEEADYGLKNMTKHYLDYQQITYTETLKGREDMSQLTGAEVLKYGCDDAFCTGHLLPLLVRKSQIEKTWDYIKEIEFIAAKPLVDVYINGVEIDYDRLEELRLKDQEQFDTKLVRLRELLAEHCTEPQPEVAEAFMDNISEFETARLKESGKSPSERRQKLEDMLQYFILESQYRPLVTIKKTKPISFTLSKINLVAEKLGIVARIDTPKKQLTGSALSIFLMEAEQMGLLSDRAKKFLELLRGHSLTQLKEGKTERAQQCLAFMQEVVDEDAPTEIYGTELNFDSPKQMLALLYCMLKLPIRVRSKVQKGSTRERLGFEGGPSTDTAAFEVAIAEDTAPGSWQREVLETIIDLNKVRTRLKLYWRPYPLWKHPIDGRIHPGFRASGTDTRRPTGSSPNLLQVSKKDGGFVRSMFIPRKVS